MKTTITITINSTFEKQMAIDYARKSIIEAIKPEIEKRCLMFNCIHHDGKGADVPIANVLPLKSSKSLTI